MKRIIVISGATSGIGLATAETLCGEANVIIGLGRTPDKAATALANLQAKHGADSIEMRPLDVRDLGQIQETTKAILARYGRIDALVNAAGIMVVERSEILAEKDFDSQVDTIFKGSYYLSMAVIPAMLEQKSGWIVNLGSLAGEVGSPKMAAYAGAKAAVASLTRSIALEYAGSGIRCVCVSPGLVDTPLHNQMMLKMMAAKSPLKRAAAPREIAEIIEFIITRDPAYLTGSTMLASGGLGV